MQMGVLLDFLFFFVIPIIYIWWFSLDYHYRNAVIFIVLQ